MKSIKFKKISITNFLSFGKTQEYDFTDGITLISGCNKDRGGDPNGSGKSTIFDALSFALFGKTMKSLTTSNLVNRIAKKNGVVRLDMEIDGKPFSIIRGVKPSFAKVEDCGKEKQFAGIKPTDQYIADRIGTDYTTFRNTVMMTSNNTPPFLQQNAETKRKFIESLFNIEFVREMANILKDENAQKIQELRENTLQLDSAKASLERFVQMRDAEKIRIEQTIKQCEDRYRTSLIALDAAEKEFSQLEKPDSVDKVEKEFKLADEEMRKIDDECRNYRTVNCGFYSQKMSAAEHEYNEAKKFVDDTSAWIAKVEDGLKERGFDEDFWTIYNKKDFYENRIMEIGRKISDLKAIPIANNTVIRNLESQKHELMSGDRCPTCGHVFTDEEKADTASKAKHFDAKINELRSGNAAAEKEIKEQTVLREDAERRLKVASAGIAKQVGRLEDKRREIDGLKADYEEAKKNYEKACDEYDKLGNKLSEASERRNSLSVKLNTIEANIRVYETKKSYVDMCRTTVDRCLDALNAAKNEVPSSVDSIKEYESKIDELSKSASAIEFDLEAYAFAKKVLGDDGYRAELVGRIVSALNAKTNEYLAKLDAPVTVTIDKFFNDNIVDIATGDAIEYDSLSGGEQRRVDLAMLLSFMDIRSMQGDARFGTLFFDEILDSALSGNACSKLINALRSKYDNEGVSSIVISHRRELAEHDDINNRVLVVKLGGVSSLDTCD